MEEEMTLDVLLEILEDKSDINNKIWLFSNKFHKNSVYYYRNVV